MKFQELKEDESLKLVEISQYFKMPPVDSNEQENPNIIQSKIIQTKVFTDGEIAKESEKISKNISEYHIGKKKYQYDVSLNNTYILNTKDVFFKNYSYVITYLLAKEMRSIGNVTGWFDIIKDVSIYLENLKDKKSLKKAKQAIKEIQNSINSVNYSSLFSMLFSQRKISNDFEINELTKNIYSLKTNNK